MAARVTIARGLLPVARPDNQASAVPRVSVIVPVLNEARAMAELGKNAAQNLGRSTEVLVVDGGSTDETPSIARSAGLSVMLAAPGRARQMNAGAAASSGDVLVFLHVDTRLPEDAIELINDALRDGAKCWGRFDVRISGRPIMLRVVALMMNLRSRWTGIATGDQAMFVKRAAFEAVGGFPDQLLMEDVELSKRLLKISRPACIARKAITSGRRWETRGVWRTILLMWRLRWAYAHGARPEDLARSYR